MEYYLNRDQECFIASLASLLLVKYKDRQTADMVYNNSRTHPSVLSWRSISTCDSVYCGRVNLW